ncbi:MAG TPA: hypothetical protein VNS22_18815 [Geminicoccus sp.]|uniref:hypothetical protein n=1 Tax=Geminicoccus sp. TaxID=2024832 RepID=UPI002D1C9321|nr:hypothetical protein [Geminicoccus sp.]HWL70412.1 hypothetical protein [Geminicoccus sp.]
MSERGRPLLDDGQYLTRAAALLYERRASSVRSALCQAKPGCSDADLRRLQRKWKAMTDKPAHVDLEALTKLERLLLEILVDSEASARHDLYMELNGEQARLLRSLAEDVAREHGVYDKLKGLERQELAALKWPAKYA